MSYASVLAENAPPVQDQPKPDPNLLEGQSTETHQNQEQERDGHHSDHSNDENHPSKKDEDEQYWNKPTWDKRIVSSVIVGVSLIMGGQGYIVKLFPNLHKK
ncbi:hypothetical protein H4Q26_002991 [Puccinia striiformis f. sp. tritici PST-130]|nr:hypothetical protein H4Q26_002991 [Puccinia striiformis f. sp. tritici PST-130]